MGPRRLASRQASTATYRVRCPVAAQTADRKIPDVPFDLTTQSIRQPRISTDFFRSLLVCITVAHGLMSLDVQTRLFEHALGWLEREEVAGRVLEIALRADLTVRLDLYPSTVA